MFTIKAKRGNADILTIAGTDGSHFWSTDLNTAALFYNWTDAINALHHAGTGASLLNEYQTTSIEIKDLMP